jgi:hypothetical protein
MLNRNEKSAPEEPEAEKRRVLFQVPSNWDDLSEQEQDVILDKIIDAIRRG